MKLLYRFFYAVLISTAYLNASGIDDLQLSGYIENRTGVMIAKDEVISDAAFVRIEGSFDFGNRGGIETHLSFNAALGSLDPMQVFKDSSLIQNVIVAELYPLFKNMDSAQNIILSDMTILNLIQLDTNLTIQLGSLNLENFSADLPYSSFYPKETFLLDRALIKLYFKPFDLFIGRQTIAWGTGYAFNPTDIWNAKNPINPTAAKTGVNAFRVEIPFGSVSGLTLVASPGRDIKHSSGGLRFKANLGNFDMSLSAMRIYNSNMAILNLPKKIMAGVDIVGQIGIVGIWAEAAVINPIHTSMTYTDFDSLFAQIVAGLDYSFNNGFKVMAEYYYNGLGKDDYNKYDIRDFIKMSGGEMSGFGQHYAMVMFNHQFPNYMTATLLGLVNITDHSIMLVPSVEHAFTDNLIMQLNFQIGIGNRKKTEYGSMYSSVQLVMTGYF